MEEGRKEGGNSRVLLLFVFRSPSNSLLPANERASSPIPHIPPTLVLPPTPLSKWHSLSDPEGKTLKKVEQGFSEKGKGTRREVNVRK